MTLGLVRSTSGVHAVTDVLGLISLIDYFHITKRFGIVPASLLPIHYMLAMKSSFSPIQFLTRLSHEQLKPIHEILGKILCFLFLWHAGFYLNFFYQSGNLSDRLQGTAEMLGLISILSIVTTSSIALGFIRRWSYRIFYFTHITLAMLILATLFFHVGHVRVYILESLAVVVIFSILRLFNIHTYANGQLTIIPQTNLIKVSIPLDKGGDLQRWKPGQHIYLSRPGVAAKESNLSSWIRKGQVNPFTVASIPSRDGKLLLIARTLKGSTKKMAALAKSIKQNAEPGRSTKTDVSVTIEGPYGCSAYLPDLWGYSRVLFVAGGVGATFIVPLKRSLTEGRATSRRPAVRFVWSVRSLAETSWAFQTSKDTLQDIEDEPNQNDSNSPFSTSSTADTHIYVTRTATSAAASRALEQQAAGSESEEEGIELEEADGLLASSASETLTQRERRIRNDPTVEVHDGRPSLSTIVDDMFVSREEKIAVIVCGPTSLERAVRQEVGRWVYKGQHDLFYHAEAFGW